MLDPSRGEQRFNPRCSTFPVRTLLAQRTRCCRVENWNPEEPSHKLQRVKVECKEEDGMELAWEVSPRPNWGDLIDGGEALIIAKPPPHVAPHRGGERGLKDGGGRTMSQLCNRLKRAHLWRSGSRRRVHLCTHRSRRGHLWPTQGKADAGMTWPTRASFGRAQEADARMTWPTRVSLGRVQEGRRAYPSPHV